MVVIAIMVSLERFQFHCNYCINDDKFDNYSDNDNYFVV